MSEIKSTAKVAVLTGEKKIEVRELPVPEINDNEVQQSHLILLGHLRRRWQLLKYLHMAGSS